MLKILKKINILMDKKQKRAMGKLLLLMVISAGLETGAVMMVMAVVQLILDPVTLEFCIQQSISDSFQFNEKFCAAGL